MRQGGAGGLQPLDLLDDVVGRRPFFRVVSTPLRKGMREIEGVADGVGKSKRMRENEGVADGVWGAPHRGGWLRGHHGSEVRRRTCLSDVHDATAAARTRPRPKIDTCMNTLSKCPVRVLKARLEVAENRPQHERSIPI